MHRILTYTFLFISMALAWWALELQTKLVVKEKQLSELRKASDAAKAAETKAAAEIAPLNENIARLTAERDEARASAGKVAAEAPDKATSGDENANLLGGLLKQMDSPEMKQVMRSQQLAGVRKEYSALFKKWALSPSDMDAVLNVLTDKEMGGASEALSLINGAADAKSVNDLTEAIKKREADSKERLKGILGDERMKEIEAFDEQREKDQLVGRYSEHLDVVGFPLNPQQRNQLAEIIKTESGAETTASKAEELSLLTTGGMTDDALAKFRKGEEEKQSRIIKKVTGVLSPDQVSGLQSAFREQNQEQEAGMKMVGQMLKSSDGTAIKGDSVIKFETKVIVPARK
jgi:hypothetical protein